MQKMKDFFELHAFGVCTAIGERLGLNYTLLGYVPPLESA